MRSPGARAHEPGVSVLKGKDRGALVGFFDAVDGVMLYSSVAAAAAMMIASTVDAVGRYAFNAPLKGTYEITEDYLLPALVFLALGYAYASGAHVRIELLHRHIPEGLPRRLVDATLGLIGLGYVALLAVGGWYQTADGLRLDARSSSILAYPLAPAYFVVAIGCTWLAVRMAYDLVTGRKVQSHGDQMS